MRPFRFSFHPIILAVFGLASGALALGAANLGSASHAAGVGRQSSVVPRVAVRQPVSPFSALPEAGSARRPLSFPALYAPPSEEAKRTFLVPTEPEPSEDSPAQRAAFIPDIANNQILAFYGKPDSKSMGILGLYSKEELAKLLDGYARLYDAGNGEMGVVPAFYLIYGTCWPGGEIGYLKDSVVQAYIDFAREKGMLVFMDHQIGKYPVDDAMRRLLPWLKYPNVHIALDPEWRTESPMREIGSVSADEINAAEAAMSEYMETEGLSGGKMLVLHQFQSKMIANRERVKSDYPGVLLIHTADGFGPPALKRASYYFNSKAGNMPLKGFKLFFKTEVQGAGYDEPLLLPSEVLDLDPCPRLIIYQ